MTLPELISKITTGVTTVQTVREFVSMANLLSPANKLALAKAVVDLQETNPLLKQLADVQGLGWTAEELAETKSNIKLASAAIANSTRSFLEPELNEAGYVSGSTTVNVHEPALSQEYLATQTSNNQEGAVILYNPWLTRLLKGAALAAAIFAIAAICFAAYYYRDQIADVWAKFTSWIDTFLNRKSTKKADPKMQYPFEADEVLYAEASKQVVYLEFMTRLLGCSETEAINFINCMKNVDLELLQSFRSVEERIKHVREITQNRRITAQSQLVAR